MSEYTARLELFANKYPETEVFGVIKDPDDQIFNKFTSAEGVDINTILPDSYSVVAFIDKDYRLDKSTITLLYSIAISELIIVSKNTMDDFAFALQGKSLRGQAVSDDVTIMTVKKE